MRLATFEGTGLHGTARTAVFGWVAIAYWTKCGKDWEGHYSAVV